MSRFTDLFTEPSPASVPAEPAPAPAAPAEPSPVVVPSLEVKSIGTEKPEAKKKGFSAD